MVPRLQYGVERYLLDTLRPTETRTDADAGTADGTTPGTMVGATPARVIEARRSVERGVERLSFLVQWRNGITSDAFVHQLLVVRNGRAVAHPALRAYLMLTL